jgi:hypothetical protein
MSFAATFAWKRGSISHYFRRRQEFPAKTDEHCGNFFRAPLCEESPSGCKIFFRRRCCQGGDFPHKHFFIARTNSISGRSWRPVRLDLRARQQSLGRSATGRGYQHNGQAFAARSSCTATTVQERFSVLRQVGVNH